MKRGGVLIFILLVLNTILSAHSFAHDEIQWQACRPNQISKAIENSLEHIKGFQEVRHFLTEKQEQGFQLCYEGLTLDKNTYQYFKNFVIVNMMKDGQVAHRLTMLFQVASIQAHHGTAERPWVILDSKQAMLSLQENWNLASSTAFASAHLQDLPDESFISAVVEWPGKKKEVSSVFLGEIENKSYFLISWIKEVNTSGSLFTGQVSPQYGLIAYDPKTQQAERLQQGSAFDIVLKKLERQLSATTKTSNSSQELIEKLTAL